MNDDFPAPAPDYSAERCEAALGRGTQFLEACATVSSEGAAWAAYNWLHVNSAGLPYIPMIEDAVRDDARFWAETASPAELQAYAIAVFDRLGGSPFLSRHIKRMVAGLWRRMSPTEQAAFLEWIKK
jgi:hypothetical protein